MRLTQNIICLFLIISFIFSCRTTPENDKVEGENISLGVPVSVKINFLGVEWENNNLENTQLSENQLVGGGVNLL